MCFCFHLNLCMYYRSIFLLLFLYLVVPFDIGKKAATDSTSNLPNARPPDVKRCRIPRTTGPAEGSDESHQGGQGKRAGRGGTVHVEESTERLGSLSEIGPGEKDMQQHWIILEGCNFVRNSRSNGLEPRSRTCPIVDLSDRVQLEDVMTPLFSFSLSSLSLCLICTFSSPPTS